jgi:hypothetical protein
MAVNEPPHNFWVELNARAQVALFGISMRLGKW